MLVKLQSLTKTYRAAEVETAALNNVNVEIRDGEFVAFADWGYLPRPVVLECVSDEWHNGRVRRNRDIKRRNRIINLGIEVLEFTDDHVKLEPEWVAKTVETALDRHPPELA